MPTSQQPRLDQRVTVVDGFPEGWALGADSWTFHRQFYARVGRPAEFGEYKKLIQQIRYRKAENLGRHYFRVELENGEPITVSGSWQRLSGVEPADFVPVPRRVWIITPRPPKVAAPEPPPVAVPEPVAPKPKRASTLTLKAPDKAAQVLATRLRKFG